MATAAVCLLCAVLGRIAAQFVPHSPAADPALTINWNPFTETWRNLRIAHGNVAVFNSIVGISWLWFFGSVFLTSFTPFARENLGGTEAVVTFLLAVFSIGIGVGSLACERLSGRRVEIGLVPFGSIGMTIFAIDLYFASTAFRAMHDGGLQQFLAQPGQLAHRRRSRAAGILRRPVFGAALCADPDARGPGPGRAHRRGEQHPECRVHGGRRR